MTTLPNGTHVLTPSLVGTLASRNLYQRLGLRTNTASELQIRVAYQARQKDLELYKAASDTELFIEAARLIEEAFATLADTECRRAYDVLLTAELGKGAKRRGSEGTMGQFYERRHLLAESKRSVLYSAHDRRVGRPVIIKSVRADLANTEGHRKAFEEQTKLFANANATNLVKILDGDATSLSIVMERMAGDLTQKINDRGMPVREARRILLEALQGLAFLHQRGMAHGRIELSHLLFDDMGGVKLAVTPGMTGIATAQSPGQTAYHVAPELLNPQAFGQPGVSVDIYSLGFVILELLCGKGFASRVSNTIASQETAWKSWLLWHASPTEVLSSIEKLVPGIPADLSELLRRMTAKQPAHRFLDAPECLEALQASMHDGDQQSSETSASATRPAPDTVPAVEILGGTPPVHYTPARRAVDTTLGSVLRNPSLLFNAEARPLLVYLGLAALSICSILVLLVGSSPVEPTPEATFAAAEPRQDDTDTKSDPNVEEKPENGTEPAAKVPTDAFMASLPAAVKSESSAAPTDPAPKAKPAVNKMAETPKPTEDGPAVVPQPNAVSGPPDDPYGDVRHIEYYPQAVPFDWCGEIGPQTRSNYREQVYHDYEWLRASKAGSMPPEAAVELSQQPIDPRISFFRALVAYKLGDEALARQLCERSLRDAEHFDVPFVLPLRLLNRIQLSNNQYHQAVSSLRTTMEWIRKKRNDHRDSRFHEAARELAWWSGIVLGYVEDVRPNARKVIDIDHARRAVEYLYPNGEKPTEYRVGRRRVHDRIKLTRDVHQADVEKYQATLAAERASSSPKATVDSKSAPKKTDYESYAAWDREPSETTAHASVTAARTPGVRKPVLSEIAIRFSNFSPKDPLSLADFAKATLSENYRNTYLTGGKTGE